MKCMILNNITNFPTLREVTYKLIQPVQTQRICLIYDDLSKVGIVPLWVPIIKGGWPGLTTNY